MASCRSHSPSALGLLLVHGLHCHGPEVQEELEEQPQLPWKEPLEIPRLPFSVIGFPTVLSLPITHI